MNAWEYFFRVNEEDFVFQQFGTAHIVLLILMLTVGFLIYQYRYFFQRNEKLYRRILHGIAMMIFFQQLSFYYFYGSTGVFNVVDGLPLYTCRVALLTTMVGIWFRSDRCKTVTVYWGLIGGILPMIFPDLQPYRFPHAMYISFFVTHLSIFWASLFFVFVEEYRFKKETYRFMIFFANSVLMLSLIANVLFHANYGYLTESPVMKTYFAAWAYPIYLALAFAVYNLLLFSVYQIGRRIQKQVPSHRLSAVSVKEF